MTDSKDKKDKPAAAEAKEPTAVGDQGTQKRSGRVSYDARGNTVWEWQLETGVYTRDVNTQKLKKLDLGELSIAETAIQKRPEGLQDAERRPAREPMPGGGFNPYDNSSKGGGFNPYDNARALGRQKSAQPAAEPARKPTDLRKLSEWIKQKKAGEPKDD